MIRSGVDIVEIARVAGIAAVHTPRFVDRILSEREQAGGKPGAAYLAGRFAAKEAVAKAMGTGVWRRGISFTDIEILRDGQGRPTVSLSGQAKRIFTADGGRQISVSISHDGGYAVAFAVAEYMDP